jgi:hypothetical protein
MIMEANTKKPVDVAVIDFIFCTLLMKNFLIRPS